MVKSGELENRSAAGIASAEAEIQRMRAKPARPEASTAEQELAELKAKIAKARVLSPPPQYQTQVDGRSWAIGKAAVLALLDGIE